VNDIRSLALAAISPAPLVNRVTIPILMVHGQDATVVRYEQNEVMARALRKAGKPVEFVTLPGDDHWLSRGATRLQMLGAVVAFLEKNNPPGQRLAKREAKFFRPAFKIQYKLLYSPDILKSHSILSNINYIYNANNKIIPLRPRSNRPSHLEFLFYNTYFIFNTKFKVGIFTNIF